MELGQPTRPQPALHFCFSAVDRLKTVFISQTVEHLRYARVKSKKASGKALLLCFLLHPCRELNINITNTLKYSVHKTFLLTGQAFHLL